MAIAIAASLPSAASALTLGGYSLTGTNSSGTSCVCCTYAGQYSNCCSTIQTFCQNTVTCNFIASGLGNVDKTPTSVACQIDPPAQNAGTIEGLALCVNPGGSMPPGLQPARISASFGDTDPVDTAAVKKGSYSASVTARPPSALLEQLVTACPNQNYVVMDFFPCSFDGTTMAYQKDAQGNLLYDKKGNPILVTTTYACSHGTMDECKLAITYDKTTQSVPPTAVPCTCVKQCSGGTCVEGCPWWTTGN